jgi:hypothetical protein
MLGSLYRFDNESGDNLYTTALNWNPDGTPGPSDDTVIANGKAAYVLFDAGTVGSATVGDSTGNGAFNMNPGATILFANPCISLVIGGATSSPNNYGSYYRHTGADLVTAGDFVLGRSGGKVDGQFAGGSLSIGGTLRLGSYLSAGYSFFELLGSGGTITAENLEVGGSGELIYNFNSGDTLKTLVVSGNVSLLSGSTLTIRGNGFPNSTGTYNYTLVRGSSRSGTFTTVNVSGFPVGGTTATVGYSGGNVTLQVIVP